MAEARLIIFRDDGSIEWARSVDVVVDWSGSDPDIGDNITVRGVFPPDTAHMRAQHASVHTVDISALSDEEITAYFSDE